MTNPAEYTCEMALAAHASSRLEGAVDVKDRERRVAFARLVREHAPSLYGVACRLLPRPADAEDAVQETLLAAWRSLDRFRGEAAPRTWLFRILLNACNDRHRRGALQKRERPAERALPVDPARRTARLELVDRVFDAVEELPRRQRECLLLRVRAGLAYTDIAELLEIGVGSVKTHLVKGRRALVQRFGEEFDE